MDLVLQQIDCWPHDEYRWSPKRDTTVKILKLVLLNPRYGFGKIGTLCLSPGVLDVTPYPKSRQGPRMPSRIQTETTTRPKTSTGKVRAEPDTLTGKKRAEELKMSQTLKVPLIPSSFSTYPRQDLCVPPITLLGTILQVSRAVLESNPLSGCVFCWI